MDQPIVTRIEARSEAGDIQELAKERREARVENQRRKARFSFRLVGVRISDEVNPEKSNARRSK